MTGLVWVSVTEDKGLASYGPSPDITYKCFMISECIGVFQRLQWGSSGQRQDWGVHSWKVNSFKRCLYFTHSPERLGSIPCFGFASFCCYTCWYLTYLFSSFIASQDGGRSSPPALLLHQPAQATATGGRGLLHLHLTLLHTALWTVSFNQFIWHTDLTWPLFHS